MTIVTDSIASQILELEQSVAIPQPPLGYGIDLSCVSDLVKDLSEVDPNSPIGMAEACARRLQTPRGALADDPDYGLDVRGYCNRGITAQQIRDLSGQVRTEIKKDDRTVDAAVTVSFDSESLSVSVTLTPADPALDTFSFVLAATSAGVLVETI